MGRRVRKSRADPTFTPANHSCRASSLTSSATRCPATSQGNDVQEPHLNIIQDRLGNYFVEVAQGAERITITPPLWSTSEATEALRRIASVTGLRTGRTV